MRKTMYYVHQSLDGFIEGPNGEFDWAQLGPELGAYSMGLAARSDLFLYGRTVWTMMSSYWPHALDLQPDEQHVQEFAPVWLKTPKLVLSTTLDDDQSWNTSVVRRAEDLRAIKEQPGGDILITGSASVAHSLAELGLLDEYHVIVHPVVLGGGKPVHQPGAPRIELPLKESRVLDGRTVLLHHEVSPSAAS
ncbi:dihydrofolate reductase family protein [Kribbella sp. NPDC051770]|uniref:dihydrofolate reductase family protein n=1 Tax=Kribbella sp. NPDC051770 TaxID=3155413 RepID=UPI003438714A